MRHSIFTAALVLFSSVAQADFAESLHKSNCETTEVRSLTQGKGSCRIIVAPKKVEKQGYCIGTLVGTFTCAVTFVSIADQAMMNLRCNKSTSEVVIDQDIYADAIGYSVATLINTNKGQDIVRNDSNEYSMFSSSLVELSLVENKTSGTTTGSVSLNLQGRSIPLDNLTCKN
ncbi:MAG: hypothetical protein ACLGHN_09095 [Bacteriovoracia bacterium]